MKKTLKKEKIDFCNLVIEKMASVTANVEESAYKACDYKETDVITKELKIYSKQLRLTRSIVFELYMHFEIMKEQKDYIPQIATEISELLLKLYKELDVYYAKALKNELHDDEEKVLFDMVNDIDNRIESYIKIF